MTLLSGHPVHVFGANDVAPGFKYRILQETFLRLNQPYLVEMGPADAKFMRLSDVNSGQYTILRLSKDPLPMVPDMLPDMILPHGVVRYRLVSGKEGSKVVTFKHTELSQTALDTIYSRRGIKLGDMYATITFYESAGIFSNWASDVTAERLVEMRASQYTLIDPNFFEKQ